MSSKAFLLLALLAAAVLLISSEVAARNLAETSSEKNNNGEMATETAGFGDSKYRGYGGRGGPGRPGGRGGYGGGRCAFGCCRSDYYGRGCRRCCSYPGQAVDTEIQADPRN
ncbi:hypothetical protein PTKIN_Ptkin12aG0069200 [Pterospermum kingtungense]